MVVIGQIHVGALGWLSMAFLLLIIFPLCLMVLRGGGSSNAQAVPGASTARAARGTNGRALVPALSVLAICLLLVVVGTAFDVRHGVAHVAVIVLLALLTASAVLFATTYIFSWPKWLLAPHASAASEEVGDALNRV